MRLFILLFLAIGLLAQAPQQVVDTGRVGPQTGADGSSGPIRQGRTLEMMTADAHARYQEAVVRGNVFTASTATAGFTNTSNSISPCPINTCTPMIGILNPPNSGKNAVILRSYVSQISGTPPAVPVCFWNVIPPGTSLNAPTGVSGVNNFTLQSFGSQVKATIGVAINNTGSAATLLRPISGISIGTPAALAQGTALISTLEETAGEIVVPPGGWAGIVCGNAAGTTWLLHGSITWEETQP